MSTVEESNAFDHKRQSIENIWYNKNGLVFVLCLLFWPLGLYGLYKNKILAKPEKLRFLHFLALVVATLMYIGVWFVPPKLDYINVSELRGINSKGGPFFCILTLVAATLTCLKYLKKINNSLVNVLKLINILLLVYPLYYIYHFINQIDNLNGPVYFVLITYLINIMISFNLIKLDDFFEANN